jgi:hypothetical protein
VIEATALVIARMQATVFGLDDGLDFAGGDKVAAASAYGLPKSMTDRLLDDRDLSRLHRWLLAKPTPAPSVTVGFRRTRQRQSDSEPPARSAQRRAASRRVANR